MILPLVVSGCVTLLGQVVLLREVLVLHFGNELVAVLGLGYWLVGGALGAAAGGFRLPSAGERTAPLSWGGPLLGLALVIPAAVLTARLLRELVSAVPGSALPLGTTLLALACLLLPASVLGGVVMRRAAANAVGRGLPLVRAYALESAGGLAGGLAATVLLAAGIGNLQQGFLAGLVAAVAVVAARRRDGKAVRIAAVLLAAGLLVVLAGFRSGLDLGLAEREWPGLLVQRDTVYGRVAVARLHDQMAVYVDGALVEASEGIAPEELVGLAAVQAERFERVAVLGLAGGAAVGEALRWGAGRVDWVALDGEAVALIIAHAPSELRATVESPRVRVHTADPRRWLARQHDLDAVLVTAPEPNSGLSNRLFTREFFAIARASLGADGVFAVRLPPVANVWTPLRSLRDGSIWRALHPAFDDRLAISGEAGFYLLAAPAPLERDPQRLAPRLDRRSDPPALLTPSYLRYVLAGDRFAAARAALTAAAVDPNTDTRPVCYLYSLALGLSRQRPRQAWHVPASMLAHTGALATAGIVAVLIAAAALAVGERRRRFCVVALAGGAGLILEAVVLLQYQIQRGALYLDLGVLLTAFMAGLGGGGWLAAPWIARAGRTARRAAAALPVLGLAIFSVVRFGDGLGLAAAALLQAALGAAVALLFALAAGSDLRRQAALAGPLLAADLLGGASASLAVSLLLIPGLGLPGTALSGTVFAVAALLIVFRRTGF
jgi:spermidine synthase